MSQQSGAASVDLGDGRLARDATALLRDAIAADRFDVVPADVTARYAHVTRQDVRRLDTAATLTARRRASETVRR